MQHEWPCRAETQLLTDRSSRSLPFLNRVFLVTIARPRRISIHNISNLILQHPQDVPDCSLDPKTRKKVRPLSSRVELPLLQSTSMPFLRRCRPARHLHIRRLHVLLRETRADFLVRLGVGFLAVARAVQDALA
jgi:hypothetical protein